MIYLVFLAFVKLCFGHISLSHPPSRRNQLSEYYNNAGLVNYNLRSPLYVEPDFFSFPCKGFPKGPSVHTFDTNTITLTLEGTAVHGGGHCQFGVSYDDKNFVVLRTVETNCLLNSMSYSFDLPEDARGNDVTVFWTWINRIGNREYYMECADVTVQTSGDRTDIGGKELLVVNIQDYPKVPEWELGSPSSIDGRDLLEARKDIILGTDNNKNTTKQSKQQKKSYTKKTRKGRHRKIIKPVSDCLEENTVQSENNKCSNTGEMRCNGFGFDTCVYNKWVFRECASGTRCQPNGESIVCV
jgi:hypothetical protein